MRFGVRVLRKIQYVSGLRLYEKSNMFWSWGHTKYPTHFEGCGPWRKSNTFGGGVKVIGKIQHVSGGHGHKKNPIRFGVGVVRKIQHVSYGYGLMEK